MCEDKLKKARFIKAIITPRYWEDAILNGEVDESGTMPLRDKNDWIVTIDLNTGKIEDWPKNTTARTNYKSADENKFFLLDEEKNVLCFIEKGYVINGMSPREGISEPSIDSDYVKMDIESDGRIKSFSKEIVLEANWMPIS